MDAWDYIRFILALVFVVSLIGLASVAAKRVGLTPRITPKGQKGRRLAIVEIASIDGKRRLVLIRRDRTEHLLLLGTNSESVVESGFAAPDADAVSEELGEREPQNGGFGLPRFVAALGRVIAPGARP